MTERAQDWQWGQISNSQTVIQLTYRTAARPICERVIHWQTILDDFICDFNTTMSNSCRFTVYNHVFHKSLQKIVHTFRGWSASYILSKSAMFTIDCANCLAFYRHLCAYIHENVVIDCRPAEGTKTTENTCTVAGVKPCREI